MSEIPLSSVDQGYAVFMSSQRRTDFYARAATEAEFKLRMQEQVSDVKPPNTVGSAVVPVRSHSSSWKPASLA